MYRIVPLEEIIAAENVARRAMDEFLGNHADTIWTHYDFCDTWRHYERLHWDDCYDGCGCHEMKAADIVHLLSHHQDVTPPKGYVRKYPTDNTILSQPQPNSLVDLAFPTVQKLLLNFVTVAHYPSLHFADFKHAQQILQDEFRIPQAVSSGVFRGARCDALPPFGPTMKIFYRRLYMKRCVFLPFSQACRGYEISHPYPYQYPQIFRGYPWIYRYPQTPNLRTCSPQFLQNTAVQERLSPKNMTGISHFKLQ